MTIEEGTEKEISQNGSFTDDCSEDNMPMRPKLTGYDFWKKTLNGARNIVAPMVDQSELPWRLLSRRHGAELCYTPMLNAKIFLGHPVTRQRDFQTCPEDHPLIAQFCGNDPQVILQAARLVEHQVEGIDLNLGCPQHIARKGHYGSYLQDEWDLIRDIISTLHRELTVPITAKIRIFDDVEKTIKYAQMIEAAGAQILTVHGRTREQRGDNTGLANWERIKLVKEAVSIPVFANGNILFKDDIARCMESTGVDGVMTSEGNLYNPGIFEDNYPLITDMVDEYMNIVRNEAPTHLAGIRGHLFKMYRPCLGNYVEHRSKLCEARNFNVVCNIVDDLNAILREDYKKSSDFGLEAPRNHSSTGLTVPQWYCRSHVRDQALFESVYGENKENSKQVIDEARPAKIIKVDTEVSE